MKKIIEEYYCDLCKQKVEKGSLKSVNLPFKTNCNWTDGFPEKEHIEFLVADVCDRCLIKSTNLVCGFQGQAMRIEKEKAK